MRTDVELLNDKDIKKMNQMIKELDGKDSEDELDELAIEATLPVEELAEKYGITIETPETQAKILDQVQRNSSPKSAPENGNQESSTNLLLDNDADFDDDSEA